MAGGLSHGGARMTDLDQRMKVLLREFFREFIALFFPQWVERFDLDSINWLDKEVFPDPPRGQRLAVDLLAHLTARRPVAMSRGPDSTLALVHIEIESDDKVAAFRQRIHRYYQSL